MFIALVSIQNIFFDILLLMYFRFHRPQGKETNDYNDYYSDGSEMGMDYAMNPSYYQYDYEEDDYDY